MATLSIPVAKLAATAGTKQCLPRCQARSVLELSRRSPVFSGQPVLMARCTPRSTSLSRRAGPVYAAAVWVLEPVGDGDTSHLGEPVEKPGPIRLEAEAAVIGRAGGGSDIVIAVPTVSSSHARVEKKEGSLVVTDLNSTNGTFLNEDRLRPGTPTPVPAGSILTFGDQHLAMFKVSEVIEAVDV